MTLELKLLVVILVLLASFSGGAYLGYQFREGQDAKSVVKADKYALRATEIRQRNVDEASINAANREKTIRSSVAANESILNGLRNDLNAANNAAKESRAAAERIASGAAELFESCTRRYLTVAENAQRADSEAREIRQAWPSN